MPGLKIVGQMPVYRESFDWAVARAVAELPVLVEYLLPLVRVGGVIIAQKGKSGPEEVQRADKALQVLGGKFRQLITVTLPELAEDRFLVIVDKIANAPSAYPRKPGIPAKKPLV